MLCWACCPTFPSRTSSCYVPHRRWLALRKSENEEPRRGASTRRGVRVWGWIQTITRGLPYNWPYMSNLCTHILWYLCIYIYIYLLLMCAVGLCICYVHIYDILRTIYNIRLLSLYTYIYIHMWHVFSFPTMVWGRKQGYQLDNVLKATIMVRKSWSFEATSLGQWVN